MEAIVLLGLCLHSRSSPGGPRLPQLFLTACLALASVVGATVAVVCGGIEVVWSRGNTGTRCSKFSFDGSYTDGWTWWECQEVLQMKVRVCPGRMSAAPGVAECACAVASARGSPQWPGPGALGWVPGHLGPAPRSGAAAGCMTLHPPLPMCEGPVTLEHPGDWAGRALQRSWAWAWDVGSSPHSLSPGLLPEQRCCPAAAPSPRLEASAPAAALELAQLWPLRAPGLQTKWALPVPSAPRTCSWASGCCCW